MDLTNIKEIFYENTNKYKFPLAAFWISYEMDIVIGHKANLN